MRCEQCGDPRSDVSRIPPCAGCGKRLCRRCARAPHRGPHDTVDHQVVDLVDTLPPNAELVAELEHKTMESDAMFLRVCAKQLELFLGLIPKPLLQLASLEVDRHTVTCERLRAIADRIDPKVN